MLFLLYLLNFLSLDENKEGRGGQYLEKYFAEKNASWGSVNDNDFCADFLLNEHNMPITALNHVNPIRTSLFEHI